MDFAYLFRVLLKRKWIIIGAIVISAVVAWFLTKNEKNFFQSTSRISTGFAIPDGIQVNEKNFTLFDAEVKFNNAINMWNSPSVISLLSYSLILHDLTSPTPFRTLDAKQMQSPAYKAVNKEEAKKLFEEKLQSMSMLTSYKPEEKKLIEYLRIYGYDYQTVSKSINIYQVARTDYIQVDATTEHPDLSAYTCNIVYEQFIRYYKSIRGSRSQESVDTLQSMMDKKKVELDEKNRLLRGEGGSVNAESMNTSSLDLIAQYEKDITTERNKQTDNYYALRKLNQRLNESPAGTNTNPLTENEELIIARRAMNNAYQEYLRTNDKAQLDKYNILKNEFNTKYANSSATTGSTTVNRKELLEKKNDLDVDIEASNEKIRVIQGKISSLRGSVNSTSFRSANVETMMEEVKVAENEYFEAKRRYNEAYDMSFSAVNNFRQIQIAQPAIEPLPSKRKMIIALAGVVSGICVVLIFVLLAYLDSSVRTPIIFARAVNLKLISLVNFVNLKSKDLKQIVAGQAKGDDRRLDKEKGHAFRESIRKLRFEIESTGKKVFLFTSTKKGEGKTTLIQALAYSLSLSNKKVLIIDTNFCNNDLTVLMNAEPVLEKLNIDHVGKTDKEFAGKIRQLAKPIEDTTISVIGSEGGDYTPSEILPTENILRSLSSLSSEFDYILLEGPPLNDFTDSRELLQYVDGVIGIFSADRIIKQIDKESISFFRSLNGKFCGAVLNKVNFENVNTA